MNSAELWKRFQDHLCTTESLGFSLDISRMNFDDAFLFKMEPRMQQAYGAMRELEKGAIANPDENRMVGHYWLRAPELAPTPEIRKAIEETASNIKTFAKDIHEGRISPERGGKFKRILLIGIGGSALGPQFVSHALGQPNTDPCQIWFFDNSDPDGMDYTLSQIVQSSKSNSDHPLASTLTIVISKSGGTKETRNGQLEAQASYQKAGLNFSKHVIAITGQGSELSKTAIAEKWITQFPMWDWVGGRTSELSAVGLVPAALQGFDIEGILQGARLMDVTTCSSRTSKNPAALLALMWFYATEGRGSKDMVILPYKDRLLLFSRYLQQLVMESLGKERDLENRIVNQGIAVYGNKGSTDQHAYIQQLREGALNFFVTFIQVLRDRNGPPFFVEPETTSGDYLHGFLQGTREALYQKDRESITITVPDVSPRTIGALIALYERAVGLYASLIKINAYHQPGVEAGKKAATTVLSLQLKILVHLTQHKGQKFTSEGIAQSLSAEDQAEMAYHILHHLASNPERGIRFQGTRPFDTQFWIE